jgi:hypothetical protein
VTVAACGPGDTEEARRAARETVQSFFSALEKGDSQELSRLAPDLPLEEVMLDQLRSALGEKGTTVKVEELSIEGTTALAAVRLERRAETEKGETLELLVPLSWENDRWVVEDSITVRQSIDFVPID